MGTGPANHAKAVFKANGDSGMTLGRKELAIWLLAEMKVEKWVGKAPILLIAYVNDLTPKRFKFKGRKKLSLGSFPSVLPASSNLFI
jgi:hypothetical protein